SDVADGSDVKAANVWGAIDTPRFNGVIPAGRKSEKSKKVAHVSALDSIPYIYFVLWDHQGGEVPRCRVWCVRPPVDANFRAVCDNGAIRLAPVAPRACGCASCQGAPTPCGSWRRSWVRSRPPARGGA